MTASPLANTAKMSSRRNFLGTIGLGALALPLLSACSSPAGAQDAFGQPSVKMPAQFAGRQTVVIWSSWAGDNGKHFSGLIKKFNESQTDIYAEVQQFDGYDGVADKVTAGLRARQIPDIAVFSDIHWNRFFLSDVLEPLNQYHGEGFAPETYQERFYTEGTVRGESYWIPFARSTPLFYYNRDMFSSLGLPDRAPGTWDELRDWGQQLAGAKYKGNEVKMRALTGGDDWYISGQLWAFGGGISRGLDVILDSPESIAAAEFERAMVHEDKSAYLAQSFATDFSNGQAATIMQSTGGLTSVTKASKFDVGAGFLPKGSATGVPTGGGGFSILRQAGADRKRAAVEVLRYLATEEASAEWTVQTGYLPATVAAAASPKVMSLMKANPNYKVAVDQLKIAQGPDAVRAYVSATIPEMQGLVQQIYTKNQPVAPLLRQVAEKLRTEAEKVRSDYESKVA